MKQGQGNKGDCYIKEDPPSGKSPRREYARESEEAEEEREMS